jgi:hypothetical protein
LEKRDLINIYEDSPSFVDGVEISGADLNVLRLNAIFLDGLVQQPVPLFTQGIAAEGSDFMGRNKITLIMPRAWWGAFQYRAGVQFAVYVVDGTPVTNERIRIYHKLVETEVTDENTPGTLVYDQPWPSTPTAIAIDISGAGYADNQIVEVVIQVYFPGPTYPKTGTYPVIDAFLEDISDATVLAAYPGLPTFGAGSTVNQTRLNQLAAAQDWIMNRLAILPRNPFINGMFVNGTHKTVPSNIQTIYVGAIRKGNNQDTFQATIDYYTHNNEEVIKIYISGVLHYTSPTLTLGMIGTLDVEFDISHLTDGNNYKVRIDHVVTPGQGSLDLAIYGDARVNSRFTIKQMQATHSRSYYSPTSEFGVLQSMTYATLKSKLNNIVTGTTNAVTAINTGSLFNRAVMFRKKVGVDTHQNTVLDNESLPMQVRIGERYVVAGRDVKIAWGGYSLTKSLTAEPTANDVYEFANVETLIGTDKVEVKEGFFEDFEGLFVGTTYYILGRDVSFFAEYLR